MKEQLTIQELSAYLPYNLKAEMLDYKIDYVGKQYDEIIGIHQWDKLCLYWSALTVGGSKPNIERIKPLLLPLSSLTKEIEHKGERFVPIEKILEYFGYEIVMYNGNLAEPVSMMPYVVVQKLFEWHFAVNISENLYIDKSTIQ